MAVTTLAIHSMIGLARVADLAEYVGANRDAGNPKSALRIVAVTDMLVKLVREADRKRDGALTEERKQ